MPHSRRTCEAGIKGKKALSWNCTEMIYVNLLLHVLSHLSGGWVLWNACPCKNCVAWEKLKIFFCSSIATALAPGGSKSEIIPEGCDAVQREMLAVTQRALGQAHAPDLDLQPALERDEEHFPSAAPFILWLSCLSLAAAAFPCRMSGSLLGRSYRFLQKALSNLRCRVSA